ncbi:SDR family oxidoreductase [Candidatus Lokiarchaeum ossiferum]|uniref:SDR family oxidoreductase n=1 Tax=Candidatus Lokiarchaeum ossiferum TaxID=2951803 RepID=UPI00352D5E2F
MEEKICMITGANSGIGKEMAVQLAKLGHQIVMICRNEERGKKALEEIKNRSGNSKIDLFIADLGNLKTIKPMVDQFIAKYPRLDVLINNAGVFKQKRTLSADGFEMIFAVAHLGHFYLTMSLLNLLKKSVPARIINVSSDIHRFFTINFNDLMFEKKYASQKAYGSAKFANVLFTKDLAKKLAGTGITVNAFHPGHVKTNMTTSNDSRFVRFFTALSGPLYTPVEKAAQTGVYLATSPEVAQISGEYFKKCAIAKSHKMTQDENYQSKLWEITEKMLKSCGIDSKLEI